jgi:hypothetical protein
VAPGTAAPPTGRTLRRVVGAGFLLVLLVALSFLLPRPERESVEPARGGSTVAEAFTAHRSGIPVETAGRVIRLLPDDTEGSRHERFLVQVDHGVTVLVAHNIDLAPRVPLTVGDSVELKGEYDWTQRGGVIHWTHHDPAGRHEAGWVKAGGRVYK